MFINNSNNFVKNNFKKVNNQVPRYINISDLKRFSAELLEYLNIVIQVFVVIFANVLTCSDIKQIYNDKTPS